MHLKMLSAANNCLTSLANLSIQAKHVDLKQTAPIGAVCFRSDLQSDLGPHCLPLRPLNISADEKSRQEKLTTFVAIGAISTSISS